jgi:solute carrier family 26 (sodium-independent sulfate anion transporter), member 11
VEHIEDVMPDTRPTLKAIILDFSSVDNVDLTSIQYLMEVRHVIDRHAAPGVVQWHFACVWNPWSKRALAAAGFGYPSFESTDGKPKQFKPIYSLAEMSDADYYATQDTSEGRRRSVIAQDAEAGRLGGFTTEQDKVLVERLEVGEDGKITKDSMARLTAVHGVNRPFFHADIQSALTSIVASDVILEAMMNQKIEEKETELKED